MIESAFYATRTGRPGQTMLKFPMDVILGEDKVKVPYKIRWPTDDRTDKTAIQRAVQQISSAKRPLILAGSTMLHVGAHLLCKIIAVGCRFTSLDTGHWNLDLPSLIQIDEDSSRGRHLRWRLAPDLRRQSTIVQRSTLSTHLAGSTVGFVSGRDPLSGCSRHRLQHIL